MSEQKYVVIELSNGTVTYTTLDKFLASKMKIIEECNADNIKEKTAYWNRIYNPTTSDTLKYHYYNKKRNRHLWTTKQTIPNGIRYKNEYKLVE